MSQYRRRTVKAIGWSAVSRLGGQLVSLLVVVVLARLLGPRDFGLIAMIAVFANFAQMYADLGFGAALIQRKEVAEAHLSSVFWVNVVVGLTLVLLFATIAPAIADFFDEPRLVRLTRAIALNFGIVSLVVVQKTLLRKHLAFRKLAIAEIGGVTVGGVLAVAAALAGLGVWALVVKALAVSLSIMVLTWIQSPWRPRWIFDWGAVRELTGFSLNFLGTNTLSYWTRNVDNLLIGRVLSAAALGVYSQAYQIFLLPLNNVSNVFGNVLFPSLALIQEDRRRVARVYLRVTRTISLVTFPMMIGLFVVADDFVYVVFGEAWAGMIPLLRVFSLVGITGSIRTITGNLYASQGRVDLQFRVSLVLQALKISLLVAGVLIGRDVFWVAVSLAVANWINHFPTFYFAGRLVGLRFRDEVRAVTPVFVAAVVMGAIVFGAERLAPALPRPLTLAGLVLVGLLSYGAILILFKPRAYLDVLEIARDQRRAPRDENSAAALS